MNLDFNEEVIQLSNTGVSPAKVGIMWPGRIVCSGYPLVQKGWYKEHRWKKNYEETQIELVNISMNHRSLWLRILTWSVVSVDTLPQDLKKLNKNKKMVKKCLSPKLAVKRLNHWKGPKSCGDGVKNNITNLNMLKPIVWSTSHGAAASMLSMRPINGTHKWTSGTHGTRPAETRGRDQQ